jgi:hypothetical protein
MFYCIICFSRINHLVVKKPFAFILWCTRSCVEHPHPHPGDIQEGVGEGCLEHAAADFAKAFHPVVLAPCELFSAMQWISRKPKIKNCPNYSIIVFHL